MAKLASFVMYCPKEERYKKGKRMFLSSLKHPVMERRRSDLNTTFWSSALKTFRLVLSEMKIKGGAGI